MGVCVMSNHKPQHLRLRERADECRRLAGLLTEPSARISYLQLAQAYDALAADEEMLSADIERRLSGT